MERREAGSIAKPSAGFEGGDCLALVTWYRIAARERVSLIPLQDLPEKSSTIEPCAIAGQDVAMIPAIANGRREMWELCRRFHVRRLDLFGSAAREVDFTDASDIDLLIE